MGSRALLSRVVRGFLSAPLASPPTELRRLATLKLLDIRSKRMVEFSRDRCALVNGVFFLGTLGCRDAFCSAPAWADSSKVGSTCTLQLPFKIMYMQSPSSPACQRQHMFSQLCVSVCQSTCQAAVVLAAGHMHTLSSCSNTVYTLCSSDTRYGSLMLGQIGYSEMHPKFMLPHTASHAS